MWLVAQEVALLTFAGAWQLPLAAALALTGGAIDLWSVALFFRGGTTVNPMAPARASRLVRKGMYRVTRNPMYLGLLLMLTAWGIWLGSVVSLLLVPVFAWVVTLMQIVPEEKVLTEKFGDTYTDYCRDVRRWF